MRTTDEVINKILAKERAIIKDAEKFLETDTYYLEHPYNESKISYKYGRVTFNLAGQILDLKRQINNLKKLS